MADKQGKDRKTGSGAGVRSIGQGNMDTSIPSPTDTASEKSAAQSSNNSGKGAVTGTKQTPANAQRPNGPSTQAAAAIQETGAGAALASNAAADAAPKSPPLDKVQTLGHAMWLMTQSPAHRHMFVADLEWLLIPPVTLGQFRLWRHGNQPIGLVTWAFVSEEVDKRLRRGEVKLKPQDWKSGESAWLIDMIMPFGGRDEALRELKEKVFPNCQLSTKEFTNEGAVRTIMI